MLRERLEPDGVKQLAETVVTMRAEMERWVRELARHRNDVLRMAKSDHVARKLTAAEIHEVEDHAARINRIIDAVRKGKPGGMGL